VQISDYGCQPFATVNCDTQRTCACNVMTGWGQCFNASSQNNCVQQWRDYLTCTENSGCRWEGMRAFNGSCIRANCFLQFSTLLTCSQQEIPVPTQGPYYPIFPATCNVASWVQNVLNSDRGAASILETLW